MNQNPASAVHLALPIDLKRVHDHCMLQIRIGDFLMLRGILLSLEGNSIRVALEDCGDAAEFQRTAGGWIAEDGTSVEIEWQAMPQSDPSSAEADPFEAYLNWDNGSCQPATPRHVLPI
jgi:hypothetical protein